MGLPNTRGLGRPTLLGILEVGHSLASGYEDPVIVVEPEGPGEPSHRSESMMNLDGISMDRKALGGQCLRSSRSWQWGGTQGRTAVAENH